MDDLTAHQILQQASTQSCGNVFSDIGCPNADQLLADADIAIASMRLGKMISDAKLLLEGMEEPDLDAPIDGDVAI